jgi:hypothetical protein
MSASKNLDTAEWHDFLIAVPILNPGLHRKPDFLLYRFLHHLCRPIAGMIIAEAVRKLPQAAVERFVATAVAAAVGSCPDLAESTTGFWSCFP